MSKELTTTLYKEIILTPDLINVIESRLRFSLSELKGGDWRIFDVNVNCAEEFGKVKLRMRVEVRTLRKLFSDLYSKPGETSDRELMKLLRSEQFQLKRKLYYILLGKIRKGMTENEANIMFELEKDKEIQRYISLRLKKEGEKNERKK
jgi:hypothetical protein